MTITDFSTATVPTSDATERGRRLTEAATAWSGRIDADRSAAHLRYRVSGSGEGAVASRITAGGHSFLVD